MSGNHTVGSKVCIGCGWTEGHRPDCTVEPGPLRCWVKGCSMVRLPGVKTPVWGFAPARGYLCPDHRD